MRKGSNCRGDWQVVMQPSLLRRIIVIVLYNVAIFAGVVALILAFVTNIWRFYNECTASDDRRLQWIVVAWVVAATSSVVLGLSGRLGGARRREGDE